MNSPTKRSLDLLRRTGWEPGVVERHSPFPKPFGMKHDFFGIIDIIACHVGKKAILAVQATGGISNGNARLLKSLAEPRLLVWLKSGGQFEVWVWEKNKTRWVMRKKRIWLAVIDNEIKLQVGEWVYP